MPALMIYCGHQGERAYCIAEPGSAACSFTEGETEAQRGQVGRSRPQPGREAAGIQSWSKLQIRVLGDRVPLPSLCNSLASVAFLCIQRASINGKLLVWMWQEFECVYPRVDGQV